VGRHKPAALDKKLGGEHYRLGNVMNTNCIINPFGDFEEAERYHLYRPAYHHLPCALLLEFNGGKFKRTLDVACGTGQATNALALISEDVTGVDSSVDMLNQARKHSRLRFVEGAAENLPFPDAHFDLVNVSMGFHWIEQEKFLKNAFRVLNTDGFLNVDCYGFTGEMLERTDFADADKTFYRANLPRPVQKSGIYPDEAVARKFGFKLVAVFPYEHTVRMTLEQFVGLITTQSNFLVLDHKHQAEMPGKLMEFYRTYFGDSQRSLRFSGTSQLYQKEMIA
jgi:SAM-dependent methyltransferase